MRKNMIVGVNFTKAGMGVPYISYLNYDEEIETISPATIDFFKTAYDEVYLVPLNIHNKAFLREIFLHGKKL